MAELKNELRWSHTRQRNWDTCRRLYYLAHYGHWNGWQRNASESKRTCYRLTKMQSLPMFAGGIVHDVIEKVLKDLRAGHTRGVDEWKAETRRLLNEGWKQSKARAWQKDPKRNVNLFEHFHGLAVSDDDIARTRGVALECLDHFFGTDAWAAIRKSDPAKWRALEELRSLDIGDFGLWVKIDFAMEDPGGCVWLFDWKTGRRAEEHLDQLMAYALYASREWGVPPSDIQLAAVYLREAEDAIADVTEEDLAAAESRIVAACRAMAAACDDPAKNTASIVKFPMVDDHRVCARCFFQSVCYDEGDWPCKSLDD